MMKEQKTKKGRKKEKKVRDKSLHEGFCDKVKKKEREEG